MSLPVYFFIKDSLNDEPLTGEGLAQFWFFLFILIGPPTIYGILLHLNYVKNCGIPLNLDGFGRLQITNENGQESIIEEKDIKEYEIHSSYPVAEDRTPWLPWDGYFHVRVSTFDGRFHTTTSLLSPELVTKIRTNKKARFKKSLFRWIRKKD